MNPRKIAGRVCIAAECSGLLPACQPMKLVKKRGHPRHSRRKRPGRSRSAATGAESDQPGEARFSRPMAGIPVSRWRDCGAGRRVGESRHGDGLFPAPASGRNSRSIADRSFAAENHGFLRHFAFAAPEVRERASSTVSRRLQVPPEAYPLRVALELRYELSESGLRVEFAFTNEGPEPRRSFELRAAPDLP